MPERKVTAIRFSDEEREAIEEAAALDHVPVTTWIRAAAYLSARQRVAAQQPTRRPTKKETDR